MLGESGDCSHLWGSELSSHLNTLHFFPGERLKGSWDRLWEDLVRMNSERGSKEVA